MKTEIWDYNKLKGYFDKNDLWRCFPETIESLQKDNKYPFCEYFMLFDDNDNLLGCAAMADRLPDALINKYEPCPYVFEYGVSQKMGTGKGYGTILFEKILDHYGHHIMLSNLDPKALQFWHGLGRKGYYFKILEPRGWKNGYLLELKDYNKDDWEYNVDYIGDSNILPKMAESLFRLIYSKSHI